MRRSKKRNQAGTVGIYILLLLGLFAAAYVFSSIWLNYVQADPVDNPGGEEDPAAEDPAGNEDPSDPPDDPADPGEGEDDPPVYPPPPGELLTIKDGDYLLALVTKQTYLGKYVPADLVPLPAEVIIEQQRQWTYYLRREAYAHLLDLINAAREDGVELWIKSAYRSYVQQEQTFNGWVASLGEERARRVSAPPGQSEHQLGTTVDFSEAEGSLIEGGSPQGMWLAENAYFYGFALSYPEGCEEITGYDYEPWHFRYIGVDAAREWKESGLVLCQFLQQKPQEWLQADE